MDNGKAEKDMNILAIETSQPTASLCLSSECGILFSTHWVAERNHDAFLFPALRAALDALGEKNPLSYILVGAGPGSYGGVRVALAAAVGIAAVKGSQTVALGSWDALAAGTGACIFSDARRGGWTLRRPSGEILVVSLEALLEEFQRGTLLYSIESEDHLEKHGLKAARAGLIPTAEGLLQTWASLSDAQKEEQAAKPAEPIYVRPPHITAAKRKPWEIPN